MDSFTRLLWWLFAGSVGGRTRARVLIAIKERPRNAQQLADALEVDYTTVRHHLKVLLKNGLVVTAGDRYGRMYFLSSTMESHWEDFEGIMERIGGRPEGGMELAAK